MFIPWDSDIPVYLITRSKVVGKLLGRASGGKSVDAQIIEYLSHKFACGWNNNGKGTKKDPGWFYKFKGDIWQAYALGVAFYDMKNSENLKDIKYLEEGMINGYQG
jgi:hypothetical protein